jgi:hypothetical protein
MSVEAIQKAVENTAQSVAEHVETVRVEETFRGQPIWAGMVEVFRLMPSKGTAYGWTVDGGGELEYVTVLGKPPIDSPLAAVRAWLVSLSNSS